MRSGILRSVAHNVADSLASGMGFPIGMFVTDIFTETADSPGGSITVDFLRGTIEAGHASAILRQAVELYSKKLPALCARQQVPIACFRTITAKYSNGKTTITIEDDRGRHYIDEYVGVPLRLKPVVDSQGRIRRKRGKA